MSTVNQTQSIQPGVELLKSKLDEFFQTQDASTTIDDLNTALHALRSKDECELNEAYLNSLQFRFAQIMKLVPALQMIHATIPTQEMKGGRPC